MATNNNDPSPLLELPRELRNRIFGYVFSSDKEDEPGSGLPSNYVWVDEHRVKPGQSLLPETCFVNKQLYAEAVPLFIRSRQFAVEGDRDTLRLLTQLPKCVQYRNFITSVKTGNISYMFLRLLQECHSLEYVEFSCVERNLEAAFTMKLAHEIRDPLVMGLNRQTRLREVSILLTGYSSTAYGVGPEKKRLLEATRRHLEDNLPSKVSVLVGTMPSVTTKVPIVWIFQLMKDCMVSHSLQPINTRKRGAILRFPWQ
ncbi:hypothetical protein NX059_008650 [Plenodomus lindquistii]|nr:hypothetical protein NX059_008650 [Plenodomus lindquistii]